jgi:hypothetical protein
MVTLHLYKLFFYFTVIWLIIGIVFVCCSIIRRLFGKKMKKGDL